MGTKQTVREQFLSACEAYTGNEIPRRGPTDIEVHPKFKFETLFIGSKHVVESLTLAIQCNESDPHADDKHPVWAFIHSVSEQNGWTALDTFTGNTITGAG